VSRAASQLFYRGAAPVVLASASPRRVALLRQVGLSFTVADPGPDRAWPGRAEPRDGVRALALDKARRVASGRPASVVIGADTLVVVRGTRMGKPDGAEQAAEMLRRLQGRTHEVWTGLAVVRGRDVRTASELTRVRFGPMSEEEIRGYVATRDPLDKAGAYGIQGPGGMFVRGIEGDYSNVVGLPLHRLRRMLAEFT
jgi:septum formation protein